MLSNDFLCAKVSLRIKCSIVSDPLIRLSLKHYSESDDDKTSRTVSDLIAEPWLRVCVRVPLLVREFAQRSCLTCRFLVEKEKF